MSLIRCLRSYCVYSVGLPECECRSQCSLSFREIELRNGRSANDDDVFIQKPILPYSSMFILSSTNCIRIFVHGIVTYPFFDTFIMIVIVLSSVALAAEDPVVENSQRNRILAYFDYGFTGIFALEMILKVSQKNK